MKLIQHLKFASLMTLISFSNIDATAQKERSDIQEMYKWDLTPLYESDIAWQETKEKIIADLPQLEKFKGTLGKSSSDLLNCLDSYYSILKEYSRLYGYCSKKADQDTRVMKYSSMVKEMDQLHSDINTHTAYIKPEILSMDWSKIDLFIKEQPGLEIYKKTLSDYFREKAHTLNESEEKILALANVLEGVPYSSFKTFNNAEMPSPEITLSNGEKVSLDNSGFGRYRETSNREDREMIFNAFWDNYKKYEATYGELLYGNIQSNIFLSKARNYASTLEAALYPNNIPVEVYYSLIENVNKNISTFYRYLELKKRMLGVDTLFYYDLYAPVVKDVQLKYSYEEAQELILKALAPLGEEYATIIQKAFNDRWIDVFPSTAKRSGAYSSGGAYDVHPYILLNFNDRYNDVSTLAHELGHTMHSYFTNKTQAFPNIDYSIFAAEVASTFNEVLLFEEIIKQIKDDNVRLSLLMQRLDNFKGTLFRQTQFAEFELRMQESVQLGKPMTGESFSLLYKELADKYYGHDKGICFVPDNTAIEWAYIPHLYYNYYVYQYSTSFTASISLAKSVMKKEKGALEKYLNFLAAGGSGYPIELLRAAGVDMTSSQPFDNTISEMNSIMDQIEAILDKRK